MPIKFCIIFVKMVNQVSKSLIISTHPLFNSVKARFDYLAIEFA